MCVCMYVCICVTFDGGWWVVVVCVAMCVRVSRLWCLGLGEMAGGGGFGMLGNVVGGTVWVEGGWWMGMCTLQVSGRQLRGSQRLRRGVVAAGPGGFLDWSVVLRYLNVPGCSSRD